MLDLMDRIVRDDQDQPETFEIAYQATDPNGTVESLNQRLYFTSDKHRDGGVRWWIVCTCGRRCRQVYLRPNNHDWRCRKCCNLIYRCQLTRNTKLEHFWAPIDKRLKAEGRPLHLPVGPADPRPFTPPNHPAFKRSHHK